MEHLMNQAECSEQLRRFGVKPSAQRIAIYRYLYNNRIHPTAETIYQGIIAEHPTLSRTTIYNTVKTLLQYKAIQPVIIEDGEVRYDANISRHAHFKCTSCGEVYDLAIPADQSFPVPPAGFRTDEIHLCFRGCCDKPECRQSIEGKN